MVKRVRPRPTVLSRSSVLIAEFAEEFKRFYDDCIDEVKPRGPVERQWVADVAKRAWGIPRLRRIIIDEQKRKS